MGDKLKHYGCAYKSPVTHDLYPDDNFNAQFFHNLSFGSSDSEILFQIQKNSPEYKL